MVVSGMRTGGWKRGGGRGRRRTASKEPERGQLELPAVSKRPSKNGVRWGGRREGAGRKPKNGVKAGASHVTRATRSPQVPLHVAIRLLPGIPRLRQRRGYQIARRALGLANRFDGARICEISIQANHVHLLIEARDKKGLTRAMKSFAISLAKNVNCRLARGPAGPRHGAVLDDRFHVVPLTTPAQVRAALSYVLGNWRRHGEDLRTPGPPRRTDRYSSGPYFDGWDPAPPPIRRPEDGPFPDDGPLPTRRPTSWLLRAGWKQHGLLSPWDRPGPSP